MTSEKQPMTIQTSEWVSLGHADKTSDFVSSYILDEYLRRDPGVRYALEVQIKDNHVTLGGEVSSTADIGADEVRRLVRDAIGAVGYTHAYAAKWGDGNALDCDNLDVAQYISRQSPDIAQGVDQDGWGDQGIFWGMATNDSAFGNLTRDYYWARKVGSALYRKALAGEIAVGLDIKTQVEVSDGRPQSVIIAAPMLDERPREDVVRIVRDEVGASGVIPEIVVNGTGRYVRHSSMGDCGTTGRKLAVDFYGGNCRIGGGSPWTKDPSKADLTLNLYARLLALRYVRAHRECPAVYVSISCCIGRRAVRIAYFDQRNELIETHIEDRPASEVIGELGLRRPIYADLCRSGLFSAIERGDYGYGEK